MNILILFIFSRFNAVLRDIGGEFWIVFNFSVINGAATISIFGNLWKAARASSRLIFFSFGMIIVVSLIDYPVN